MQAMLTLADIGVLVSKLFALSNPANWSIRCLLQNTIQYII